MIQALLYGLAVVGFSWIAWWWFVARNRPAFPPLVIENNDPLMVAASRRAIEEIPKLRLLFQGAAERTSVKVPFVTSTGETEHLWAELLDLGQTEMQVRYLTPPVTHSGILERVQRHPTSDIEDWVVKSDLGPYVGGYTMRVMFQRGRELWGELPPALQAEAARYTSP
jgi:uncharacterized protein YegJ (DUF2314 family)